MNGSRHRPRCHHEPVRHALSALPPGGDPVSRRVGDLLHLRRAAADLDGVRLALGVRGAGGRGRLQPLPDAGVYRRRDGAAHDADRAHRVGARPRGAPGHPLDLFGQAVQRRGSVVRRGAGLEAGARGAARAGAARLPGLARAQPGAAPARRRPGAAGRREPGLRLPRLLHAEALRRHGHLLVDRHQRHHDAVRGDRGRLRRPPRAARAAAGSALRGGPGAAAAGDLRRAADDLPRATGGPGPLVEPAVASGLVRRPGAAGPLALAARPAPVRGGGRMNESLRRYGRVYAACVRNCLARELEFRSNFLFSAVSTAVWAVLSIVLAGLVFTNVREIRGWDMDRMFILTGSFLIVESLMSTLFQRNMQKLSELVNKGELDFVLTRPISSQFLVSIRYLDFGDLPTAVVGLVYVGLGVQRLGLQPGPVEVALYTLLLLCALASFYALWRS